MLRNRQEDSKAPKELREPSGAITVVLDTTTGNSPRFGLS
jgi:hypothetical protein